MIQKSITKIIAHRGAWNIKGGVQNSIFALIKAAEFNYDGTEFDIHLTKDNVLIVYHDDVINGRLIEDSLFEEILSVRLENNEQIPTLEAYLNEGKKYPNLNLVIEIKSQGNTIHEAKLVNTIGQLLNTICLYNEIEFISFSSNVCNLLKLSFPNNSVSYLNGDLSPKQIKERGWDGFDYDYNILLENPSWIKEAKDLGLTTNSWTVNDKEIMNQLLELGIGMITTDEPELLKNYVK